MVMKFNNFLKDFCKRTKNDKRKRKRKECKE